MSGFFSSRNILLLFRLTGIEIVNLVGKCTKFLKNLKPGIWKKLNFRLYICMYSHYSCIGFMFLLTTNFTNYHKLHELLNQFKKNSCQFVLNSSEGPVIRV
jgi:hypothetical protein